MFKNMDLVKYELLGFMGTEDYVRYLICKQDLEWCYTDDYEKISYTEYYTDEVFRFIGTDIEARISICHNPEENSAEICSVEFDM